MSKPSWQDALDQMLHRSDGPLRVAVVGIGHELRGDDAAGVLAARALLPLAPPHGRLLIIDAGAAPENCTGALRRFHPDLVLLIDAADIGAVPGAVRWLEWRAAEGCGVSTHTLPIALLANYLTIELGCTVALLGIQPAHTWFDAPLSGEVAGAIDDVARTLAEAFVLRNYSPETANQPLDAPGGDGVNLQNNPDLGSRRKEERSWTAR